jgi:ABC-type dipeptide/oligopeptide/nickel transport system ATPase component
MTRSTAARSTATGTAAPGGDLSRSGPALEVSNLSVTYLTGQDEFTAVKNATFDIRRGERVALIGESGSGKTSLGLAIGGFLRTTNARVESDRLRFLGTPLDRRRQRSRMAKQTPGMGMIFQDALTSLDPVWTVGNQLRTVLRRSGLHKFSELNDMAEKWLRRVGIADVQRVLAAKPYELSGGMCQRVMIALTMCSRPTLVIADEPTSALDVSLAKEAMELLVEMSDEFGVSLLIVSHDIKLCRRFTDRIMVMYRGEIVESGDARMLEQNATHPYTQGLFSCIPTLDDIDALRLPTLADFAGVESLAG